jgi:hypothetical protein
MQRPLHLADGTTYSPMTMSPNDLISKWPVYAQQGKSNSLCRRLERRAAQQTAPMPRSQAEDPPWPFNALQNALAKC